MDFNISATNLSAQVNKTFGYCKQTAINDFTKAGFTEAEKKYWMKRLGF